MAKIRYYIAASADGFVASDGGGVDWLDPYTDPSGYGYNDFYADIETLVMGRATYDQVQNFGTWPYDDKPTYVVTRRPLDKAAPACVQALALNELVSTVSAWRADADKGDVWIVGGPASTAPLIAANLIDTYELSIMPDLLGTGIRLFADGTPPGHLKLLSHKAYADGVLSLVYAPDA